MEKFKIKDEKECTSGSIFGLQFPHYGYLLARIFFSLPKEAKEFAKYSYFSSLAFSGFQT